MKITIKKHGFTYDKDEMLECPECDSVDLKLTADGTYVCAQCLCEFSVGNEED
jgi:ribosomal protein L37AE/L43A